MTLSELHVALLQAGIPVDVCNESAEAMVRDGHVISWTSTLTSGQAARMMWLSFIAHTPAAVKVESQLLRDGRELPQQDGDKDGETVTTYLANVIRDSRHASNIAAIEVDAGTRKVKVELRDAAPVVFAAAGEASYPTTKTDRVTVGGTFLSRASMAYSSRVWLPLDQQLIQHHVQD